MNPFPLELNEDEEHQPYSALSFPILLNPNQDQVQLQQEVDHTIMEADNYKNSIKLAIWKKENEQENQCEKWMSSKMRIMKKMMKNSDRMIEDNEHASSLPLETENSNSNTSFSNTIRFCSDCNTTKTPLWRSGPRGPKTLCNACGIRQRKARRAAAAATAGTIVDVPCVKKKVQHKEKRSKNSELLPFKKRCKLMASNKAQSISKNKICFEDFFTIRLSENSTFSQELKEAAIVLMALSYGLVHG